MSHLIETMAYSGQTPWHQLGHALPQKQPLEVWAQAAGMQWQILETPVRYLAADGMDAASSLYAEPMEYPEQKVLYRSDTKAPLSVVSNRYQVVQPRDVLEFYRDLTEVAGYELETAGVLKAGRKFWALARTGKSVALKGDDQVNGYGGSAMNVLPPVQTLAARVAQLAIACRQESASAYAKARGREEDVQLLLLVDGGFRPRTAEMDALRAELGLSDPLIPSLAEFGRLNRMLYMVHGRGKASAPAVGG